MYALPPLPLDYDPNAPPPVPEHSFPPTYTAETMPSFELALLACNGPNVPHSVPYSSCCVLEDRFLLLGCSDSLQLVDLLNPAPPKTIIWTRVRCIKVIESCRTILIVSSRHRQVRCYSLDAILILCYGVLRLNWSQRKDLLHDVPDSQAWRRAATTTSDSARRSMSDNTMSGAPSESNTINSQPPEPTQTAEPQPLDTPKEDKQMYNKDPSSLTLAGGSGLGKLYYLYRGIIPQDYFFKIPDCKDVSDLDLYLTTASAFIAVVTKEKVAIWQRARNAKSEPWQRIKVFWIPAEPRSLSLADDRSTLRYVLAVFRNEATVINLRTSKVQIIKLEQPVTDQYHVLEKQNLPHPSNTSSNEHHGRSSRSDTTLPWNSLKQLPFYPDTLPPTSLTEEYSVPPPYSLVAGEPLDALHDPVALPSTAAPQLFLATLARHSFIIDLSGSLFSRTVYSWSEEPLHIEFAKITPSSSVQLCIIGFLSQSVEVIDVRTGMLIHTVPMSGPVKYLGRWDDDAVTKAIFWTCNVMNRTYVYMLRLKI